MTTSGGLPPAGWYPDPADSTQQRWWNGAAWTDQTTPAAATSGSPASHASPSPFQTPASGYGSGDAAAGAPLGQTSGQVSGQVSAQPAASTGYYGPTVLLATTEQAAGHRVTTVVGDVVGIAVRPRAGFATAGAAFVPGTEAGGYAALLKDCRREALDQLRAACHDAGGNAVLALRVTSSDVADYLFQTTAYGTAVTLDPAP